MTLLGGTFQMGTSSTATAAPTIDQSLDDIIKQRSQKASASAKKSVSNVDRSVATSRVKRDAAIQARRGITQSSKPTRQQIETAVQQQAHKTAIAKVQKQQQEKIAGGKNQKQSKKEKMEIHKQTRELKQAVQPSKKQVKAAKKALIDAGFQVPPNHTLVIAVQPAQPNKPPNQPQQQQPSNHPRRRRPQKKSDSTRMNTSS